VSDPVPPLLPEPGPFTKSAQIAAEKSYELLGLKPTHGGYLPRGLSFLAPTSFAPQPIGFVDPAAYGFHHDFLFGITYDRAVKVLVNPEGLERELEEAHALPHTPVRPKQIRGRADVSLFDAPFLIGSGQLDFFDPDTKPVPVPRSSPVGLLEEQLFNAEKFAALRAAPLGLFPVVEQSGQRALYLVTSPGVFIYAGSFSGNGSGGIEADYLEPTARHYLTNFPALNQPGGVLVPDAVLRSGSAHNALPSPLEQPSGGGPIDPTANPPVRNDLAFIAGNTKPPLSDLEEGRTDP
jgi:hypothetical protein